MERRADEGAVAPCSRELIQIGAVPNATADQQLDARQLGSKRPHEPDIHANRSTHARQVEEQHGRRATADGPSGERHWSESGKRRGRLDDGVRAKHVETEHHAFRADAAHDACEAIK